MMGNENLLPKNIRQIGEIRGRQRICLEDYVMTYIRKTEEKDAGNFLGVFLGERKNAKDMEYIFARGLLKIPDPTLAKAEMSAVPAKKTVQEEKSADREPTVAAQGRTDSGDKEKWKQDKKLKDSQDNTVKNSEHTRRTEISEHAGRKVPEENEQPVESGKKALTERADSDKAERRILKKSLRKEASEETGKTEYSEISVNSETTESGEKSRSKPGDPWERLKREQEMYFPGCQILGCCVIGRYPAGRLEALFKHFPEARNFLYHLQDQEERLYWLEEEKYQGVQGYFVYYEQNRRMQEYLEESFGEKRVESEGEGDSAIIRFREKVKSKAEEKSRSFLKLASSFFVVGVLLVGVVAVNRVEGIRNNTSDLSAGSAGQDAGNTQSSTAAASSNDATGDTGATAVNSEYTLAGADAFWSETTEEGESAVADVTESDTAISGTTESNGAVSETSAAGTTTAGESVSGTVTSEESAAGTAASEANTAGTAASGESAAGTAASEANTADTAASGESAAGTAASEANTTDAAVSQESTADTTSSEESASYTAVSDTEAIAASSTRQIQATYVIREGDTLAAICAKYYGSLDFLEELCEANEISDADLILPGQKIILP